jgi:DNA-binding beta-propeller fold protein YncE
MRSLIRSMRTTLTSQMLRKAGRSVAAFLLGIAVTALAVLPSPGEASAAPPALLPVPFSTVPSNGDLNPYGVVLVTGTPGGIVNLSDNLISNFNNKANVMGTGTTIVDIRDGKQLSPPFYTAMPAFKGLSLAFAQLGKFFLIGNVPVSGTKVGPGALTVLNSRGMVLTRLADPKAAFIDGPWGLAINAQGSTAQLFVSNLINGTVWRLDAIVGGAAGVTLTSETRIGAGYLTAVSFPASANGPAGVAYDAAHDILYVASEADNEIFAIANAGKITTNQNSPGVVVYQDDTHLHGPTGLLLLSNGHLLTANDDGVNVDPAQPSEIVEFIPGAPTGTFVTQYSVDPANGGAFGIGLHVEGVQNLETRLGYVDDNTATYSILSLYFK